MTLIEDFMQNQLRPPVSDNFLAVLILSLFVVVWVDRWLLLRYEGKIKRGVKIWSRSLSQNNLKYLIALKEDVVELYFDDTPQKKAAFIRKSNGEVIINYRTLFTISNLWAYVGYVDLRLQHPRLEFRSSFFMNLCNVMILLIMFFGHASLWVFVISLILLAAISRHEAEMIMYFLDRETNYYLEEKATSSPKIKTKSIHKKRVIK